MNSLENRKFIILIIFGAIGFIYLIRLFQIQVISEKWDKEARSIVAKKITVHPPRGLIYDRNMDLLVENYPMFNLVVTPVKITEDFDTTAFCELVNISKETFIEKMHKAFAATEFYKLQSSLRKKTFNKYQKEITALPGFYFKDLGESVMISIKAIETQAMDTLRVARMLEIDLNLLKKKFKSAWKQPHVKYKKRPFIEFISAQEFAKINQKLYLFPGFQKEPVSKRYYPNSSAAQMLGYIREVDQNILDKNDYYHSGDYIGIKGIEAAYEEVLRGKRGTAVYLRTAREKLVKNFDEGSMDTLAEPGYNLFTGIDPELQNYGEELMQNKTGAIVALDPNTGEVLCMVSAPSFDPNLLTGKEFSKNWSDLYRNDSLRPLNNRALTGKYRPGSIFKLVQSLIGMQEGVITQNTGFSCNKSLIGCHNHEAPVNIVKAIQHSCNPYFYNVYKRIIEQNVSKNRFEDAAIGLMKWKKHMNSFGLGVVPKIDIIGAAAGQIPDTTFYNRWYGRRAYAFSTIYSNAIGEGEVLVTPIQMANIAAIIANKGWYYPPHVVKEVEGIGIPDQNSQKLYCSVDSSYFTPVIEGMAKVVTSGTARQAFISDSIAVCGKTGTIQNGKFRDHSCFIAFAPKENPKIAIAVYVEYAGFGGSYAAPIASLLMEKYLTDTISDRNKYKEQRMLNTSIYKDKPIVVKTP